jgi:hypothetical protein
MLLYFFVEHLLNVVLLYFQPDCVGVQERWVSVENGKKVHMIKRVYTMLANVYE